jgi:hypothetical protein
MPTTGAATGFIGRQGASQPNVTAYSTTQKYGNQLGLMNRLLNRSHGTRRFRATLLSLTGAASGAASKAYSNTRIAAVQQLGKLGYAAKQSAETVAYQTGNSTAGDLTTTDAVIAVKHRPGTYPTDKSGFAPGKAGGKL